jgi:hypothetical protein
MISRATVVKYTQFRKSFHFFLFDISIRRHSIFLERTIVIIELDLY